MLSVASLLRLAGAVLEHLSVFVDLGSGPSTVMAHLLLMSLLELLTLR